jgi:hypothetical protein
VIAKRFGVQEADRQPRFERQQVVDVDQVVDAGEAALTGGLGEVLAGGLVTARRLEPAAADHGADGLLDCGRGEVLGRAAGDQVIDHRGERRRGLSDADAAGYHHPDQQFRVVHAQVDLHGAETNRGVCTWHAGRGCGKLRHGAAPG